MTHFVIFDIFYACFYSTATTDADATGVKLKVLYSR